MSDTPPTILGPGPIPCATCGGSGKVLASRRCYLFALVMCPRCKGAGSRRVLSSSVGARECVARKVEVRMP